MEGNSNNSRRVIKFTYIASDNQINTNISINSATAS